MLLCLNILILLSLTIFIFFYIRPLKKRNSVMHHKMLYMGKEFIANASHELKTPITIIRGFAETLKDLPEVSDLMFESILEKIIRNCERMENLVTNLLILADLENHSGIAYKECDLVPLVGQVCMNLLHVHPEAHFEKLHNDDTIIVRGDVGLLEIAFTNILKNALKYSNENKHITITLEKSKEGVLVSVRDRGIGIKEEDLERIFDRFYTVDKAHSRKLGGAGLGLSIVKMVMDKHEATIKVHSKLTIGTNFAFSFPLTTTPRSKNLS